MSASLPATATERGCDQRQADDCAGRADRNDSTARRHRAAIVIVVSTAAATFSASAAVIVVVIVIVVIVIVVGHGRARVAHSRVVDERCIGQAGANTRFDGDRASIRGEAQRGEKKKRERKSERDSDGLHSACMNG